MADQQSHLAPYIRVLALHQTAECRQSGGHFARLVQNVERALREKNEALETADLLKVDFVQHVSYELRSPLTNIIGFAELLADPSTQADIEVRIQKIRDDQGRAAEASARARR